MDPIPTKMPKAFEDTIEGTLVFDGAVFPPAYLGLLSKPITLEFKEGRLIDVYGEGPEAQKYKDWFASFNDPNMYRLAHFSQGFNPGVTKLTGRIVEDERFFGCMEFGIGSQGVTIGGAFWNALLIPTESSMHIAATLGRSFSIIIGRNKWILEMNDNVHKYCFADKLASFRSVNLGVLDFHADPAHTEQMMRQEINLAIKEDRAESIILGCTMQFGFFEQLQKEFSVPIIDFMLAALKYVELLVEIRDKMNWYTSKVGGFATPDRAEIKEWCIEEDYNIPRFMD